MSDVAKDSWERSRGGATVERQCFVTPAPEDLLDGAADLGTSDTDFWPGVREASTELWLSTK